MQREFIILPNFEQSWKKLGLNDDELRDLENEIMENPEKAPLIPGTGGIRKIRIKLPGRGKSGGARVIYIDFIHQQHVYFLAAYAKNKQENLTDEEKKILKSLVELLKKEYI